MPTVKKKHLSFDDLKDKAKEAGIPFWGKTRGQLEIDLKVEDGDVFIIDRAHDFTREQLLDFDRKNTPVPAKTIGYKKDREIIEEYLAYNDLAFNGCDLTNERAAVRHIFGTKDVKCYCGEKFRIERLYYKRLGAGFGPLTKGEARTKVIEPATVRMCPNCNRKWIYHDMQTAKAASGKYEHDL